jgi:endogenous inhibitor of DNA gyrase (YacG/DUF329 family)
MRTTRCPICKKPVDYTDRHPTFPFCSDRCKLVDLGNWLDGRYRVASEAPFGEEKSDLPDEDDPEGEPS